MASSDEKAARLYVSLAEGEPASARIETALDDRFRLVTDCPQDCSLRLVGSAELAEHGSRLLRQHRLRAPDVPVVVVTDSNTPARLVRDCFRNGAADVIREGEIEENLLRSLDRAIQRASSGREREDEAQLMAAELGKRARELEVALETVRESYDQTLGALVAALDCRERETAYHSQRVAVYSVLIGLRLRLDAVELENLFRGALLHDIGKIGIPDAVLLKPGSFTDEEWAIMRRHTEIGAELLGGIDFLHEASDVPLCHHEAWNGSGYPTGLKGKEIPLKARIFAVVDSYDAIRSKRPYKSEQSHEEALPMLEAAASKRLDPDLVEIFKLEPEQTWIQLETAIGESITFEDVLEACREVAA